MKFNFGSREMINTRFGHRAFLSVHTPKNINSFDIEGNQDPYKY